MGVHIKSFLVALVLIPVLDFVWLGKVMQWFYVQELKEIGRIVDGRFDPLYGPAFAVYVLLAVGIVLFALPEAGDGIAALWRGAILGLIVYGVYDMTNMATLRGYGLKLSLVDMAWGTVVCGAVSWIVYALRAKEII